MAFRNPYQQRVRFQDDHDHRGREDNVFVEGTDGYRDSSSDETVRGGGGGRRNMRGIRGRNGRRGRGRGNFSTMQDAQNQITRKFRGQQRDWRSRSYSRGGLPKGKSKLDDGDDVSMMDRSVDGLKGRSGSRGRYMPAGGQRNIDGKQSWFRVVIPHGRKMEKKFILDSLNNMMDIPFTPTNYHAQGETAVFFVQSSSVAEAIRACSRRITNDKGFKVLFHTSPCNPPGSALDEASVEKIKVAMSNRYTPEVKSLDLSDFHNDEMLNQERVYPVMARVSTMKIIAAIIHEHIPEVECVLLSSNRLSDLGMISELVTKATNVTKLDLSKNNIQNEAELDKISDMKLVDLRLDKNPISRRFSEESHYVSAVRKRFPKLVRLDGHELPPPISFALDTVIELPTVQGSFFLEESAKGIVLSFLEEYFRIYDGQDRQKLLEAYHEKAYFSLSVYQNKISVNRQHHLGEYQTHSRNLKILRDTNKKHKTLICGRLGIAALLNQLPQTQHDSSTISVDINLVTPDMMSFTVTGVFKEPASKQSTVRAFSRVFITVPHGSGIVILNEQLTMTNAASELIQKSFTDQPPTPTPTPSPVMPSISSSADVQQEMIRQFSEKSGMNAVWSAKCLEHNGWDYERSAKVFTEMMSKHQVPPEAFVSTVSNIA